jgi:hypothetical protein
VLDNAAPLWFATYDNVEVVLPLTSHAINDDNLYASRSHSPVHSEGKSQPKSLFTGTNNVFYTTPSDGLPLWANNILTNRLRVNLISTSLPTDGRIFSRELP